MKTFLAAVLLIFASQTLLAQYGGYAPSGATNYLGSGSAQGIFTDTTYNDGSITSAASAIVNFMGSAPNARHQILAHAGGATATQIGNAILNNGTGGLFINNPSTGLEIITNFNFNAQNAQVTTLRNASSIASNNLHIDANATISGYGATDNVDGYLKKDGDAFAFTFPLADGAVYAPMAVGPIGTGNSITAAYYKSSGSAAAAFEGGSFPVTSVSLAGLTVSSTEYWDINSTGSPTASLSLTFQGDYSTATLATLSIVGWKVSTSKWEQVPSEPATGLTSGSTINSTGNVNFSDYSAFTLGFVKQLLPTVTATSTLASCGQQNGTITAIGAGGTLPYQFSIDGINFQSSNVFSGLASGTYIVIIKDANGLTSTVSVTVNSQLPGKIFAGNDTSIAINQPLQLNAIDVSNEGYDQFTWSPAYGLNNTAIQNPIATLDKDITYTVTAIAPDGCKATAQITIKVYPGSEIYVPTAFTPNGDGKNDLLKAIPVGLKEFRYFVVYDRWGQRVFYTSNASIGWDGKVGNKFGDLNTYVWMAEGIDIKGKIIFRKGTVVLIR